MNQVTTVTPSMLPADFAQIAAALPVVDIFFGKAKNHLVDSRLLHGSLRVARVHSTWIKGQIEKHGLIEGVDYWNMVIDPDDHEALSSTLGEHKKNFARQIWLTPKACAKIATHTAGEVGDLVFNYMYHVTNKYHEQEMAVIKAQVEKLQHDVEWMEQRDDEQTKKLNAFVEDTKMGHVAYYDNRQNMRKLEDENKRLRSTDTYKNDLVLQQASKNFYRLAETLRDKKIGTKDMLEEVVECAKRIDERDFTFVACF